MIICLFVEEIIAASRQKIMKNTAVAFMLILATIFGLGVYVCDQPTSSDPLEDVCYQIFQQIEDALNEDRGNMYMLRKAFFYAPNARPVLMKVIL